MGIRQYLEGVSLPTGQSRQMRFSKCPRIQRDSQPAIRHEKKNPVSAASQLLHRYCPAGKHRPFEANENVPRLYASGVCVPSSDYNGMGKLPKPVERILRRIATAEAHQHQLHTSENCATLAVLNLEILYWAN